MNYIDGILLKTSWFDQRQLVMKKRPREVSQSETAKYFEWITNDLTATCIMRVSRLWLPRSRGSPFLRHLEWSRRYCGNQFYKRASLAIACEYSHFSSLSFCQQRRLYSPAILARKRSKTYPYICANPVISVDPNWVLNSWNWLPSTRRANTYKSRFATKWSRFAAKNSVFFCFLLFFFFSVAGGGGEERLGRCKKERNEGRKGQLTGICLLIIICLHILRSTSPKSKIS